MAQVPCYIGYCSVFVSVQLHHEPDKPNTETSPPTFKGTVYSKVKFHQFTTHCDVV